MLCWACTGLLICVFALYESKRMDEENKCHVLLKAIWSMWWLLVIIWCADVSTHRRHRMEGGGRQHRPTVGKIGSGVNGQCFSKLLLILIWQATRYPNHCPDYYDQEFMFYSGRSSFSVQLQWFDSLHFNIACQPPTVDHNPPWAKCGRRWRPLLYQPC